MFGIVLDIATICFFVYMFKKCAVKSQLQNTVESLVFILSAFVSVPLGIFLGDFCYINFFRPVIIERVDTLVKTAADVDSSIDPIARIMNGMPSMVNNAANTYQTTTGENLKQLNKLLAGDLNSVTGQIVDIMARPVIEGLLRALFFGLAFVACYQFFKAFYPTIEAYFYNPDRAAISPTIGMVLGSGKIITVFLIALSMIRLVGAVLPDIFLFRASTYSHSFIYSLFNERNLILLFLGNGIIPE